MSHHAIFLTIWVYAVIAGITTVIASMNGHAEVAAIAGRVAKLFTLVFLLYLAASLLSARLDRRQCRNRHRTSKNLA